MDVEDSACFATPKLRQGPTSRLLKRRSQIPPSLLTPKTRHSTSVHNSILGDERENQTVTYAYDAVDVTAAPFLNFTAGPPMIGDLSRSIIDADETTYGIATGLRATDNLYVDFLATVRDESSGLDTLEQVAEFEELVSGQLETLKRSNVKADNSDLKSHFTRERSAWRLLGMLYHDRLSPGMEEDHHVPVGMVRTSEKMLMNRLFRQDRSLREGQIVVDWLELNARDNFEENSRLDYFSEANFPYENTVAVLKDKSSSVRYGRPIVSAVDPDAPRREGKPLHDTDIQDQNHLLKTMYFCIRAGLLETAQDLCIRMGQSWRAAALEGWKLFHDPNYDEGDKKNDEKVMSEGNRNRDVWKKVVWNMIQDDKMGLYERAIFAPFCGHVAFLLALCSDWEDWLWSNAKCMVDLKMEKEIRGTMPRTFAELPQEYWNNNKESFGQIFEAIDASDNPEIRRQSALTYHVVEKHLILATVNDLLDVLDVTEADDPHLLRFLAHLVIVLRRIVPEQMDLSKGLNPIRQYALYLMSKNRVQQVAWYVSLLPKESQVFLYAKFLETIYSDADRRLVITLAVESSLPIGEIKSKVVENVFASEDADDGMRKIDALEWLLYDKGQRAEAVYQANALIRRLIATDKFDTAKEACLRIPEDSSDVIADRCTADGDLNEKQSATLKEFLCWQLYFKAKDTFSDWFQHYHKARPLKPSLPENPSFTEKVAHEQKMKQFDVDMERWDGTQEVQSSEAQDRLLLSITFSGGWLMDQNGDHLEYEDEQRKMEIEYLRKLCLPQLVLLLHSVLHKTRQFEKALKIADLVASEQHCLYEVYVQDNMRELLSKLRESSLEAMQSGSRDAWAHEVHP